MVKEFRILKLFIWINETNTEYILFVYKGALKAVQSTGPLHFDKGSSLTNLFYFPETNF